MPYDLNGELQLGFLLHDVSRLRRSVVDRALKPLGVTRSQWSVLAFLSHADGMSQAALAEALDLGKVALGGLVDRLERAGLVARKLDRIDRRIKRVHLTKAGRSLIAKIRANVGQTENSDRQPHRRRRFGRGGARAARDEGEPARDAWRAGNAERGVRRRLTAALASRLGSGEHFLGNVRSGDRVVGQPLPDLGLAK